MQVEKLPYFDGETECMGFLAYDQEIKHKRPCVMIAPAWRGQDDFARERAMQLAKLGYVGFALDVYGEVLEVDHERASEAMAPFFLDRPFLRDRLLAAYSFILKHPMVDKKRVGAIGFCFGGLCVYELFRSGAPLKGVICIHAVLSNESQGQKAKIFSLSPNIKGSILILNGYDDPLVTSHDLSRVAREFSKAKIDWQIHNYGNTMHAFTNPKVNDEKNGTVYNEKADRRSWQSLENFFSEVFA